MGGGNIEGTIMAKQELKWATIPVTALSPAAQAAWEEKKAADQLAKAKREAFEAFAKPDVVALLGGKLPAGKQLVCGYRFGKFSAALSDGEASTPKATPIALTLAGALGL